MSIYDIAKSYTDAGLSVMPVKLDGSKAPYTDLLPTDADGKSWKRYQQKRASDKVLRHWFLDHTAGIGIIGGSISGNLERMDYDYTPLFGIWLEMLAEMNGMDIYKRLPVVETPGDGYHIYYRCEEPVPGNKVLAKYKGEDGKYHVGIETRGEGGYCVAPGSPADCHPTCKPYKMIQGDLTKIPVLTGEERELLTSIACSLNEQPEKQVGTTPKTSNDNAAARPGDDYNSREDWREIIEQAGWKHVFTRGATEFWRRPGKDTGISASWNYKDSRVFYVFTSNSDLEMAASYTPFGLFATIKHNGDYAAAASELSNRGLGQPTLTIRPPSKRKTLVFTDDGDLKLEKPDPEFFFGLIPPGYISEYVNFASNETDAPQEFHLATALWSIAAVVGNRLYCRVWGQNIYPHLWIILLAPSGFYRKSTSISIAKSVVKEVDPEVVLPDDFSRERLMESMQTRPDGSIVTYEFGEMLSRMNLNYMMGTKEFLTTIYDGNSYERQLKSGTIKIENPAPSFLSASTIEWIMEKISDGDIRSGFLARYTYWCATTKNGWKGIGKSNTTWNWQKHNELANALKTFSVYHGEAVLSDPIREQYDEWLHAHETGVNEQGYGDGVQGFFTRLGAYCLKFAMLYNLALGGETTISAEAMDYAIRLTTYLRSRVESLITNDLAVTPEARELKRVLTIIKEHPGCTKTEALRLCKIKVNHFNELLETLDQAGLIVAERFEGKTKPGLRLWTTEAKRNVKDK